jgi:hypothetical protein
MVKSWQYACADAKAAAINDYMRRASQIAYREVLHAYAGH